MRRGNAEEGRYSTSTDCRIGDSQSRTFGILNVIPPGRLGYCDLEDKVIGIDWRIGRRFRQVMLHEIAHALRGVTGHDAHDEQWYDIASNLGCTFANLVSYFMALPPKGRTI